MTDRTVYATSFFTAADHIGGGGNDARIPTPFCRPSLDAGVLTLTLNRPDKLNAFNEDMHLALRAGFERAEADAAVRAVLLTGAGRGFCAGQDLGDRDPRKGAARPISARRSRPSTIRRSA